MPLKNTLTLCFLLINTLAFAQKYVKQNATGDGSGSSWANASGNLQAMIDAAASTTDKQVWVAAGTYKPIIPANISLVTTAERQIAFVLRTSVKLYGGFNAVNPENTIESRNFKANVTILSGDIDNNDSNASSLTNYGSGLDQATIANNSYQVIKATTGGQDAIIDGFNITSGNADGSGLNGYGAGIYASSITTNLYLNIFNCNIFNNTSKTSGGGIYVYASNNTTVNISNTLINNNTVIGNGGGGLYLFSANIGTYKINNTQVNNNISNNEGGGVYAVGFAVSVSINNTQINNNKTNGTGGGLYTTATNPSVVNSLIIKNSILLLNKKGSTVSNYYFNAPGAPIKTITYSYIEGETGVVDNHNIDGSIILANLKFVDANNGDFRLALNSPLIDAGNNADIQSVIIKDLDGNDRIYNNTIDIGPYEYTPITLNVNLIDYTAKEDKNGVLLQWRTASENNNHKFVIYRSNSNADFIKIGEKNGNGTSKLTNNYTFYDRIPLRCDNYYKLVQIDLDGKTTDLGIRTINYNLKLQSLKVYPNPTVSILIASFDADIFNRAVLIGLDGKVIEKFSLKAEQIQLTLDLMAYPKGIYFLHLLGNTAKEISEIVKN